ncbi:hypothetical protein KPH14_007594 [Odynerus spinipes]|uniref:Uncharacterized protein n=1 Tax=Odynerus spinipes TaxID=1348599 RepID=A0AAD9RHL7_9HYME|nr:hypothetical protein KPH14_007594 [Odynerus spinipes]
MFLVVCFFLANVIRVNALNDDNARVIKLHDYPIVESHESNPTRSTEKSIFTYQRAGVRVDIKIVSLPRKNSTGEERKIVESFPEFPARDIGRCVLDLSLICVKKRFAKLLESIARLDEIALIGQDVKLVKTRVPRYERRSITGNDVDDIERSIDDFFDTFVLRITLPRWNGKRERNQIDVMFDESGPMEVFEGSAGNNLCF